MTGPSIPPPREKKEEDDDEDGATFDGADTVDGARDP
jgi:hypothetical protein